VWGSVSRRSWIVTVHPAVSHNPQHGYFPALLSSKCGTHSASVTTSKSPMSFTRDHSGRVTVRVETAWPAAENLGGACHKAETWRPLLPGLVTARTYAISLLAICPSGSPTIGRFCPGSAMVRDRSDLLGLAVRSPDGGYGPPHPVNRAKVCSLRNPIWIAQRRIAAE